MYNHVIRRNEQISIDKDWQTLSIKLIKMSINTVQNKRVNKGRVSTCD